MNILDKKNSYLHDIRLLLSILIILLLQTTSCSLSPIDGTSPDSKNSNSNRQSTVMSLAQEEMDRSSTTIEEIPSSSQTNYFFLRGDIAYNNHDYESAFYYYRQAAKEETRPAPLLRERLVELYLRSGDLKSALQQLEKTMNNTEADPDLLRIRGLILIGLENYQEALNILTILRLKYDNRSEDTAILTGVLQLATNEVQSAVGNLKAWVHENPNSYLGHYYLALALIANENYNDAETSFRSALALRPVPTPILIDFCKLLMTLGKVDEAKTIVSKLSETAEEDKEVADLANMLENVTSGKVFTFSHFPNMNSLPTEALIHTATSKFETRDFLGAQMSLFIVLANDSDNSRAHYYLGSTYLALQELDDAIEELLKINRGQMFFEDSRTLAAYLLQGRKDYGKSVAVIKELVSQSPNNPRFLSFLANVYKQAGDLNNAALTMEEIIKLNPAEDKLIFSLGVMYDDLGQKEAAIASMKKAIAVNPSNANALNYLAYTYAELETNLDESLTMIERALKLEAENGYFVDTLGWIYYKMGRYEDALREMKRSVELVPNDAVILEHLAHVQIKLKKYSEARTTLQRALDNAPDSEDKGVADRVKEVLKTLP